ncbi:MAG: hypothetical protein NVSMB9_17300 [Isosphaeraceae bacterium]
MDTAIIPGDEKQARLLLRYHSEARLTFQRAFDGLMKALKWDEAHGYPEESPVPDEPPVPEAPIPPPEEEEPPPVVSENPVSRNDLSPEVSASASLSQAVPCAIERPITRMIQEGEKPFGSNGYEFFAFHAMPVGQSDIRTTGFVPLLE